MIYSLAKIEVDTTDLLVWLIGLIGAVALVLVVVFLIKLIKLLSNLNSVLESAKTPILSTLDNLEVISGNLVDISDDITMASETVCQDLTTTVTALSGTVVSATEVVTSLTDWLQNLLEVLKVGRSKLLNWQQLLAIGKKAVAIYGTVKKQQSGKKIKKVFSRGQKRVWRRK